METNQDLQLEAFKSFKETHWNSGPTLLQLVISAHLYVENNLDQSLCKILPNDRKLVDLSFWNKVVVARSIGFDKNSIALLEKLNNLRNKFAHNLNYKISWNDLKDIEINSDYVEKDWEEDPVGTARGILSGMIGGLDGAFEVYARKRIT
jgi:hypothetical protein